MRLLSRPYKLILIILVLVSGANVSQSVVAQVRKEPLGKPMRRTVEEEKAREQTRWMFKNLSLDLDQYDKVNAINLQYAAKFDSVDKIKSPNLKTEATTKLKKSKEEEIKKVLTEQQFKQYIAHRAKQSTQKKSPFTGTYLGN